MYTSIRLLRPYMRCMALLFAMYAYTSAGQQMTIAQADNIFLSKNLGLLAGELNVKAEKALEIQSRAYPNPGFQAEFNMIDPQNNKFFHAGTTGQKGFSVDQLILLGGKRKNEIAMAKQNTAAAELELRDLLRDLKQQLHSSLYSVYFDELTLKKYNSQLQILDTIITSYQVQADKGNISLKEVLRLKAVYLGLNNDRSELLQNIQEQQKNLQILLQTEDYVSPNIDRNNWNKFAILPSLDSLYRLAYDNRADLRLAELNTEQANLNLRYQKALRVPDLTVGAAYDQRGGAFNNQTNLTVGIPLPLWDRNKGNIRSASVGIQLAEVRKESKQKEVQAEVGQVWKNMQRGILEYEKATQLANNDFSIVFNGVTENFKKRNLSVLEFVDFFESYNETIAEINRISKQLAQSAEAINFTTGTSIYQ